jgi:hypothetical protein
MMKLHLSRTSDSHAVPLTASRLTTGLVAVISAFGLAACGGGGSDSGSTTGTVGAPAKLDSSNYKTATATVAKAGFGLADEDLSSVFSGNAKTSAGTAAKATLKALDTLRQKGGAWSGTTREALPCTGGGSITIDASFTFPSTSSVGDHATITYDNCIDLNAQSETDGILSFRLTHVGLGDFFVDPAYEVRITYTFTQLRTINLQGTAVTDGSIELESVRQAVHTGHDSLRAPRLETSFTPLTGARTWSTVHDFLAQNTYAPGTTTTTLDGTVAGSDGLNEGSVTVDTTTPFVRNVGHYPHIGVITVTGDQGTWVKLEALNDTTVHLTLDSNGDGTVDRSEDVPWSDLW